MAVKDSRGGYEIMVEQLLKGETLVTIQNLLFAPSPSLPLPLYGALWPPREICCTGAVVFVEGSTA